MPSIETFSTSRLLAERIKPASFDELCRMHQDPQVMATLGGLRSDDETRQFLQRQLDHWDEHGHGLWMFRDKENGQFVGRGGLRRVEIMGNREVEVAYALMAECWGKGLATEMASASVAIAFDRLGLPDLVSFTSPTNRASQRVMEKAGFRYEREGLWANLPHVFYRLRASDRP